MKNAIVTGASSGIGLSIARKLISLGYRVYGVARDFSKAGFEHEQFVKKECDLTRLDDIDSTVKSILDAEENIQVLVNNAGVGYIGPHENVSPAKLEEMVRLNLLAPLVLTNLVLKNLKETRGHIINIGSHAALQPSRFGCAYAATKAGIHHFGISLFDEVRKSGVKVITIHPDIVDTPFFDGLPFSPKPDEDTHIEPECVAESIENILKQPEGAVITQLVIRPQRHDLDKTIRRTKQDRDDTHA